MYTVSLKQFLALVEQRKIGKSKPGIAPQRGREKVLRSDQRMKSIFLGHERRLTTCPQCDAAVDEAIIHPRSGLCPICHAEAHYQR